MNYSGTSTSANCPRERIPKTSLRGSESDVFLVHNSNFTKFKRGDSFKYTGGHYNSVPGDLACPARRSLDCCGRS